MRSQVARVANEKSCSPSEIIRRAIEQYFIGQRLLEKSEARHQRITEYSQVALDTIILEQHPEFRDRIVAETDRRMDKYHGPR